MASASAQEPVLLYSADDERQFNTFVGIDFGTTYSGYAFAIGRHADIFNGTPQKILTALLLDKDGRFLAFGEDALKMYEEASVADAADMLYFDRFKMKLHSDWNVHGGMEIATHDGAKTANAVTVFSRSLEYFYKKAKREIGLGDCVAAKQRESEIKWVITVPAIWGQPAKNLMINAAEMAGMPTENVDIALEPEAAMFASKEMLRHVFNSIGQPAKLRVMVVDCGGGTVDVKVQDIDMTRDEYEDKTMADGGPWGGTVVDKHIRKKITEFIGEEVASLISPFNWLLFERGPIEKGKMAGPARNGETTIHFSLEMTAAIRQAGGDLQESPGVPGIRYRRGRNCLVISKEVMEECFQESINNIYKHIDGLLCRVEGIHCILMVGGLSESALLLQRIKELLTNGGYDCRLVHPIDPSLVVARGAVLHGQRPHMVRSRISRFTYGIQIHVRFDPGVHDERRKTEKIEGRHYCKNVFRIYVHKGESIQANDPGQIKSFSPLRKNQTAVTFVLFKSENVQPKYTDEPGCKELNRFTVKSPNVELGLNRTLDVKIDFSYTTLRCFAVDRSSSHSKVMRVPFESC